MPSVTVERDSHFSENIENSRKNHEISLKSNAFKSEFNCIQHKNMFSITTETLIIQFWLIAPGTTTFV